MEATSSSSLSGNMLANGFSQVDVDAHELQPLERSNCIAKNRKCARHSVFPLPASGPAHYTGDAKLC